MVTKFSGFSYLSTEDGPVTGQGEREKEASWPHPQGLGRVCVYPALPLNLASWSRLRGGTGVLGWGMEVEGRGALFFRADMCWTGTVQCLLGPVPSSALFKPVLSCHDLSASVCAHVHSPWLRFTPRAGGRALAMAQIHARGQVGLNVISTWPTSLGIVPWLPPQDAAAPSCPGTELTFREKRPPLHSECWAGLGDKHRSSGRVGAIIHTRT